MFFEHSNKTKSRIDVKCTLYPGSGFAVHRRQAIVSIFTGILSVFLPTIPAIAQNSPTTALGIDVDFYTGPITREVWLQLKAANQEFAIAQAWGGRSRNEFASAQLAGARMTAGMKTGAYVLLNFDNRVCRTFSKPIRNDNGTCAGPPVSQPRPGARWQVQQGIAALGSELAHVAFIAIDVEWFLSADPPRDASAQARRRQYVLDAIDEVRNRKKLPVIYTRNAEGHWQDITGCALTSIATGCRSLYRVINDPKQPIPLWDVENGSPDLTSFRPYSGWTRRAGRQYKLDTSSFGLPPSRTVDLNVFDVSIFRVLRGQT
jgi:hypothetical protein